MSTAAAQRALLEALAAAQRDADPDDCGYTRDPLTAFCVGLQSAVEFTDAANQPLIAAIYDKLGCLALAVRDDLTGRTSTDV